MNKHQYKQYVKNLAKGKLPLTEAVVANKSLMSAVTKKRIEIEQKSQN